MLNWQQYIVVFFGLLGLVGFVKGVNESKNRKNAFGLTPALYLIGSFVWADAVIFGLFWFIFSILSLLLADWLLFLFGTSVFWAVRGFGETTYWLHEQFAHAHRNAVKSLFFHSVFHDDSIWFVYQIFWQCVTVIAIIASVYVGSIWLK